MTSSRLTVVLTSCALLLGACSGQEAPEVDDIASSPTVAATEEATEAAGSARPEPEETATAEPSPEPSPCPAGQQRITPTSACFQPSPAPEPEPEPAPEPAPTQDEPEPEPEPQPASNPCDERGQQDHAVTAINFDYDRSLSGVCSGDTVTLTVAEGSHSFTVVGAEGDTGVFGTSEGSRATTVSGTPGTYQFRCTLHPNQMSGQIELIG